MEQIDERQYADVIGVNIAKRRRTLGRTLKAVAEKVAELSGMEQPRVYARLSQYERKQNIPSAVMLRFIAQALGVPMSYFFTGAVTADEEILDRAVAICKKDPKAKERFEAQLVS